MISLVVITKNNESTILRCIESTREICDEFVVVIDADNSDNSESILLAKGVKVFHKKFINFSDQKNFGISKTNSDWILSLDADEYLSNELVNEIKKINFSKDISAYSMPRQNIFFGKPINHTNWGKEDDRKIRLFNKQLSIWKGVVHEDIVVKGRVAKLENCIIHEPYKSVEDFLSKMNQYTTAESKFTFPLTDFLRRYVLHLGILDGVLGLFMSYLMVIYHTSIWVKLWLKKK